MILIQIILSLNYLLLIKSTHNSFKNECGPYQGLDNSILMPKKEECLNAASGSSEKCCYVEGEKNLLKRTACILIENTSEERIKLIQDLSEIATKLNVDCGDEKKFESDCGVGDKKEKDDCFNDHDSGGKCCFVKINSPQFEGQGCKLFDSIDLNDIGEAVVAAKTVDADLEVKCFDYFLNMNIRILALFIFIFFL